MDKTKHGQKRKYHIFFFISKRNANSNSSDDGDGVSDKKKPRRVSRRCLSCLIAFVVLLVVFCGDKIFHRIPQTLSDYFQCRNTSQEVRHVGFLKVHKAGGSTIQNILFRFGVKRNLSLVIPVSSYKFSDYGVPHSKILSNRNGKYYDILALHSVYDERTYSRMLPRDTVNIAIIRNPLDLMVSAAYYHRDVWDMDYLKRVPRKQYIRNLILYPELYDQTKLSWTRNSMAMDFGFSQGLDVTDVQSTREYLLYLNEKFQLVMVMEQFDESLVLLRRLMNWTLRDILYLPLNTNKHPSVESLNLSPTDKEKFDYRNFLDDAIYKFFSNVFEEKLANAGRDFMAEVHRFKVLLGQVKDYCASVERGPGRDLEIGASQWNEDFSIKNSDCDSMEMSELEFIDTIRDQIKSQLATQVNV